LPAPPPSSSVRGRGYRGGCLPQLGIVIEGGSEPSCNMTSTLYKQRCHAQSVSLSWSRVRRSVNKAPVPASEKRTQMYDHPSLVAAMMIHCTPLAGGRYQPFIFWEILPAVITWDNPPKKSSQNFVTTRKILQPPTCVRQRNGDKKGHMCHHGFGSAAHGSHRYEPAQIGTVHRNFRQVAPLFLRHPFATVSTLPPEPTASPAKRRKVDNDGHATAETTVPRLLGCVARQSTSQHCTTSPSNSPCLAFHGVHKHVTQSVVHPACARLQRASAAELAKLALTM